MNIRDVMDEIAAKLDTITGLRAFGYPIARLPLPGAVVGLPDDITFDAAYGRGSDELTLPLWVMVARGDERAAAQQVAEYLNGTGTKSVKTAVDSTRTNTYTACDTVTIARAATGAYTYNGVDTYGAEFTVTVTGSGS